jgi:hypothetical protein
MAIISHAFVLRDPRGIGGHRLQPVSIPPLSASGAHPGVLGLERLIGDRRMRRVTAWTGDT